MNAFEYVMSMHEACAKCWHSTERAGPVTNSEIRRWLKQGVAVINGQRITDPQTKIDLPVRSFVMFPKSPSKRTTYL